MKKKIIISVVVIAAVLIVLFVPFKVCTYKDGGTREIGSLTYKIVDWNRIDGDSVYHEHKVYFIPRCYKDIDELFQEEMEEQEYVLTGTVTAMYPSGIRMKATDGQLYDFSTEDLDVSFIECGSVIEVTYKGSVRETYPAGIDVTDIVLISRQDDEPETEENDDTRKEKFDGEWIDADNSEPFESEPADLVITKIYADCFFADTVIPSPYMFKLDYVLPDEYCVGDHISVMFADMIREKDGFRIDGKVGGLTRSDFQLEPGVEYKPVIYLYPEKTEEVDVQLKLDGELLCTYPEYRNGWHVTAEPGGGLRDGKGRYYPYLFWEGKIDADWDLSEGYCVKGSDTARFFEDILPRMGLNEKETAEFIVFWLPHMEKNPYNIISFQGREYTDRARLKVTPEPDTVIRVFMVFRPSDKYIEMKEPVLCTPERKGFTLTEWGGTKVK